MERLLLNLYWGALNEVKYLIRVVLFGGPACYLATSILISLYDTQISVEGYLRLSLKIWVIGAVLLTVIEWFDEP